jgi:hypothetical protein
MSGNGEITPRSYEFSEVDKLTLAFAPVLDELAAFLSLRYNEDKTLSRKDRSELHPNTGLFSIVAGKDGLFRIHNARDVEVAVVPKSISRKISLKISAGTSRQPTKPAPSNSNSSKSDASGPQGRGRQPAASQDKRSRSRSRKPEESKAPSLSRRRKQENSDALLAKETDAASSSFDKMDVDEYDGDCNLTAEQRQATSDFSGNASYASALRKDKGSPPDTIATASTVSTAQSGLSSLRTPSANSTASQRSSVSGKLLNTHPRRHVDRDGVANFVSVSIAPSRAKKSNPSVNAYQALSHAFAAMKKCDPDACWYPIYDAEPGDDPIPAICDVKDFPKDLDRLQMQWCSIENPWDLREIHPGEVDYKTGEQRKAKPVYTTVLVGGKYQLDHVLQMCVPSLTVAGVQARRKEVDALRTKTIYAIIGIPSEWDDDSVKDRLRGELEKHEEWMQGNVRHGYNAQEYQREELPAFVIIKRSLRLPEGKDILSPSDLLTIDYTRNIFVRFTASRSPIMMSIA